MRPLPTLRVSSAAALLLSLAAAGCSDRSPTTAARPPTSAPSRLLARPAVGEMQERTIASGYGGSLAIRQRDGAPVSWSSSNYTPPAGLTGLVSIAPGGYHVLGLRHDGTVVGWAPSGNDPGTAAPPPPGLSNAVAVAAGLYHSLALKADGTVVAWGWNGSGQATVPAGLTNVVAIAGGSIFSLALKSDGTVVGWGGTGSQPPAGLDSVVAIATGFEHGLALRSDGTVVVWGSNRYGALSIPEGLSGVVAIATGVAYSVALKEDGTVVGWGQYFGLHASGVPAGLTDVVAIAGGYNQVVALRSDGTVVCWGWNSFSPPGLVVRLPGSAGPHAVIAGLVSDTMRRYEGTKATFSSLGSTDARIGRATYTWSIDGVQTSQRLRYLPGAFVDSARFADQGTHGLTLQMTDEVGGSSTASAVVVVSNALPVVSWASAPSLSGNTLTVCPTFGDLGANDNPWSYTITWGDRATTSGSTATQGALGCFGHTYAGASGAGYTAVVRVTDKDGGARAVRYSFTLP
jgi:hypothetical protein